MDIVYYVFVAVLLALIGLMWWLINAQAGILREAFDLLKDYRDITMKQGLSIDKSIENNASLIAVFEGMRAALVRQPK